MNELDNLIRQRKLYEEGMLLRIEQLESQISDLTSILGSITSGMSQHTAMIENIYEGLQEVIKKSKEVKQ